MDVASLDEIQAVLPNDSTLILYGVSEVGSYALLITENDLQGFIFDATTADIEDAISAFAADRLGNTQALSTLYDLVFAPIAKQITTSRLIISPDGGLNYVPFAALQAHDGSYLIDDYAISMIPSGTMLVLLNEQDPNAVSSTPGITLAQPRAPGLPPLRYAQTEAASVAAQIGVVEILGATEADLREYSAGAQIISIFAHAELDRFAPMFSAIHLGAGGQYDGRLEVREIYELDLTQGTELVILSGSETGSDGTGEDFALLNRAFLEVGADRVVASLWSVDDAATSELLTAFVAQRQNWDNDAEALRAAMLATRNNNPDPYFWASFVLTGLPS